MSDEHLAGSQGKLVRKARAGISGTIYTQNRKHTERSFQKGEISFKQTPLGGCTSSERCDSRLNLSFTSCLQCSNALLVPSKVQKFSNEIESSMKNLPENSVEYRLEKEQWNDLQRFKAR